MGHNRQPELYAAALIPYTAATIALGLRLLARNMTRHLLAWEDYLAIVAFVREHTSFYYALLTIKITGSGFTFLSLYSMFLSPTSRGAN
jgi:hypothetical protein